MSNWAGGIFEQTGRPWITRGRQHGLIRGIAPSRRPKVISSHLQQEPNRIGVIANFLPQQPLSLFVERPKGFNFNHDMPEKTDN